MSSGANNHLAPGSLPAPDLPDRLGMQFLSQLGVAVVSKLVPLASIFIYSRFMSVADYGVLNVSMSYLWIIALLLSLNLHVGIGRYIYEIGAKQGSFLASTLLIVGGVYLTGAMTIVLCRERLAVLANVPPSVIFPMLAVVLGMISESVFTQLMIHDKRGGLLFKTISAKAALSMTGSLILLASLPNDKYLAILIAESIASLGLSAFVAYLLRRRLQWLPSLADAKYMAKYALPLIPYMLALTLLSQFDRILIDRFYGKETAGYYSIGYNFGALLPMAVGAALNALTPTFFHALNQKKTSRIHADTKALFDFATVGTVALVLFGPDIAALLLPVKYSPGFNLIPFVALGGLCSVIFQSWVRVLAFQHRTAIISVIATTGSVMSIGLNYWFLPIVGYQFAVISPPIAYLLMSFLCVTAVNRGGAIHILIWHELKWIALIALIALVLPIMQQGSSFSYSLLKFMALAACIWVLRSCVGVFSIRNRA